MDYFDILKRAWSITWRYKALWVLGLFAGAASGGGGGGGNTGYSTGSGDFPTGAEQQFINWFSENLVLIVILIALLAVVGLAFWVLSIAAQGGLVYGANEAAESRAPRLGSAWGVGFRRWGRTFMISFVVALPVLAIVLVPVVILTTAGIGGLLTGEQGAALALGGVCLVLPIMFVLLIAAAIIAGIVYQLALRYGVLQDVSFGQAIKRGWSDLWGKRGAFVFWLVMIMPGIAYGFITLILIVPFVIGMIGLVVAEQYALVAGLLVLMVLLLMIPGAIYGTFVSSAWTVFFRRMTGMEEAPVTVAADSAAFIPPPPPTPPYHEA